MFASCPLIFAEVTPHLINYLKTMNKRTTGTVILITYIAILIKVMVVKDMPLIRIGPLMLNFGGSHEGPANLLPFKTILSYLFGEKGLIIALINLVGNIVLLVPIGFLVPFVYRNMTLKKSLVLAVTAGVTIEMMQVVSRVGIFDIDDIILNALGVIIGYWTFTILAEWMRSKKYKNIVFAAIMVIAATAAVFYAIYPKERQSLNPGNSADVAHSDRIHDEEGEDSQDGAQERAYRRWAPGQAGGLQRARSGTDGVVRRRG